MHKKEEIGGDEMRLVTKKLLNIDVSFTKLSSIDREWLWVFYLCLKLL